MTYTENPQTLGDFVAPPPNSKEYLKLQFSPTSEARRKRWRNSGISADFLGDYFATFFPGDEVPDSKINKRDTVKAAVSYIANELLENALKFTKPDTLEPITVSLYLYEHQIILQVINTVDSATAQKYQTFIQRLLDAEDFDQVYIEQLEKTATGAGESSMGILTLISDYSVRFGWKFETTNPQIIQVNVLGYLDLS
jgi:hypothetical protein